MLSKLTLDDAGLARCRECGKLHEPQADSGLCRECQREQGLAEAEAHAQHDPGTALKEKTERLMALFTPARIAAHQAPHTPRQAEGLLHHIAEGAVCSRCKKHSPISESDFCLSCHLELDSALGTASRDLLSRVELYEPPRLRKRGPSVMDVYGDKATEMGKNAVVPPHSQSPRNL